MVRPILLEKKTVHMPDIQTDPDYNLSALVVVGWLPDHARRPDAEGGQANRRDCDLAQEVRPFTDKQIELATDISPLRRSSRSRTRDCSTRCKHARVILQNLFSSRLRPPTCSRSSAARPLTCETVLQTLVESAARLCDADKGNHYSRERWSFYRAADLWLLTRIPGACQRNADRGGSRLRDRAGATGRRVIHIPDVKADPEYTLLEGQRLGDYRTVLAVPMLREGVPIGVLTLTRSEVRPFTDKQIELVTTFADQGGYRDRECAPVRKRGGPHARTGRIAGGLAHHAGPSGADTKARFARSAHRRHRPRDQEPAQFRQ